MSRYDWRGWLVDKLNPAQEYISRDEGIDIGTQNLNITYSQAFDKVEVVNRGVSMVVNAVSSLDFDIKNKVSDGYVGVKAAGLNKLLNYRPNPYQSINDFRKAMFMDFTMEGNVFLYFDGVFLYHLPAEHVLIHTDSKTYVNKYTYNNETDFSPDEIIHFKDLNSTSIYRGASRLISADRSIKILYKMQEFQDTFFKNGAIPGLVLGTENSLSEIAKEKTIKRWMMKYSPTNGARKPMILDSGLKPFNALQQTFQEMDFESSISTHDAKILKAIGVPPILLDGGNNANISPNLRLFYLETVMPIVRAYVSAIERFFGYDVEAIVSSVSALQPELKDLSQYYTTLVNGGVITPEEARIELRYPAEPTQGKLRIPANIAGSAADPSQGGAPKKPAANKE